MRVCRKAAYVSQAMRAPVSFESNPHGRPQDSLAQIAPVINSIARPAKARQAVLYIRLSRDSRLGSRSRNLSVRKLNIRTKNVATRAVMRAATSTGLAF